MVSPSLRTIGSLAVLTRHRFDHRTVAFQTEGQKFTGGYCYDCYVEGVHIVE